MPKPNRKPLDKKVAYNLKLQLSYLQTGITMLNHEFLGPSEMVEPQPNLTMNPPIEEEPSIPEAPPVEDSEKKSGLSDATFAWVLQQVNGMVQKQRGQDHLNVIDYIFNAAQDLIEARTGSDAALIRKKAATLDKKARSIATLPVKNWVKDDIGAAILIANSDTFLPAKDAVAQVRAGKRNGR